MDLTGPAAAVLLSVIQMAERLSDPLHTTTEGLTQIILVRLAFGRITPTDIVIQYNESYGDKTAAGADGGGFDLDGGTQEESVMQYNYSHDNDRPGFLLCQYPWGKAQYGQYRKL